MTGGKIVAPALTCNKSDFWCSVARLASQMAEFFSKELYGPEGPELDSDMDEFEDLAVLAARAAFDAVIAGTTREALKRSSPSGPHCSARMTDSINSLPLVRGAHTDAAPRSREKCRPSRLLPRERENGVAP